MGEKDGEIQRYAKQNQNLRKIVEENAGIGNIRDGLEEEVASLKKYIIQLESDAETNNKNSD